MMKNYMIFIETSPKVSYQVTTIIVYACQDRVSSGLTRGSRGSGY